MILHYKFHAVKRLDQGDEWILVGFTPESNGSIPNYSLYQEVHLLSDRSIEHLSMELSQPLGKLWTLHSCTTFIARIAQIYGVRPIDNTTDVEGSCEHYIHD